MNKKLPYLFLFTLALAAALFGCAQKQEQVDVRETLTISNMKIISTAFGDGGNIPSKYTCDGQDVNPPLTISEVPEGAKSLVLIVDDPDAPAGDWVHWTMWNIPVTTSEIPEGSVPAGATVGLTDFGKNAWGGPCPPSGVHHYNFKLYALDAELNIDASSKKKDLEKVMGPHVIAEITLTGIYKKK
jgi:Raf kinase inhibitor-like YbhB/YbcL family protein